MIIFCNHRLCSLEKMAEVSYFTYLFNDAFSITKTRRI
jgi:hypothetical protein